MPFKDGFDLLLEVQSAKKGAGRKEQEEAKGLEVTGVVAMAVAVREAAGREEVERAAVLAAAMAAARSS